MLTHERRRVRLVRLTLLAATAATFFFLWFTLDRDGALLITSTSLPHPYPRPPRPDATGAANPTPFTSQQAPLAPATQRTSPFLGPNGEIAGFAPPTLHTPGSGTAGLGIGSRHPPHTLLRSAGAVRDGRYFAIRLGGARAYNPNLVPHPHRNASWIVVAQRLLVPGVPFQPAVEVVCSDARFLVDARSGHDVLACVAPVDDADDVKKAKDSEQGRGNSKDAALVKPMIEEPPILPVRNTSGPEGNCPPEIAFFSMNMGPHDARVFYGPDPYPYIVYGSNSKLTCFGMWVQDFAGLLPDDYWPASTTAATAAITGHPAQTAQPHASISSSTRPSTSPLPTLFTSRNGTELQRPPPYAPVEKNWFLFWAFTPPTSTTTPPQAYVHFDIQPRRVFALLHADGSVGPDLSSNARAATHGGDGDDACLARLPPHTPFESVHQATNSLAVTLCRRTDPACVPDENNTFILFIFQHKTFYNFHYAYHPYVMVFRQRPPFELWAIGKRPLWIAGRNERPSGDTEMFYITSMSWKGRGQRYHGYADDVLFLAFGIEDRDTGAVDVVAGDLLANLGLC